ncbi:hypothetical protein ONZ45_g13685 [Pleurotus djamor]|nr:hypothetical protein ONZ45_g13685 [Pleurotus djamor]
MTLDKVFVDTLQLSGTVGKDCWGRLKPQQVTISIYLHLKPLFLDRAGLSDDVRDSVHYGHLTKSITNIVQSDTAAFKSVDDLARALVKEASKLAGDAAVEVRLIIGLPKFILMANGFEVDWTSSSTERTVSVKDLILYVIIGVNPPEREAKQRVIVNISVMDSIGQDGQDDVDYTLVVNMVQKV